MISMKLLLIASLVTAFACVFIKLPSDQQESNQSPFVQSFRTVSFELRGSTVQKTYNAFILNLRNELKGPVVKFGFPMMRDPDSITDANRFLLVKLSNSEQKLETTLAVRVRDAYVVGFCCGKYDQKEKKDTAWFFTPEDNEDKEQNKLLFKDKKHEYLGYKGNYPSLGDRKVTLGRRDMIDSIATLGKTEKGNKKGTEAVKKPLLVLLQMVAEAARYRYISEKVAATMKAYTDFTPDQLMISYENSWAALSRGVATSDKDGVFQIKNQVVLKDKDGKEKTVTKVDDIKNDLSLLTYVKT